MALRVIRVMTRGEPDPVVRLSLYRPEFFGRAWMGFVESTMRGPSEWRPAERELIAAFVSRLNACPYCAGVHGGIATILMGSASNVEKLDHWREAHFDPRIEEAFELLELAKDGAESKGETSDSGPASRSALEDALYVGFLFNTVNRLANALDFQWTDDHDRMRLAGALNRVRYHAPAFLLR